MIPLTVPGYIKSFVWYPLVLNLNGKPAAEGKRMRGSPDGLKNYPDDWTFMLLPRIPHAVQPLRR